jgi:hypothetical protein
MLARCARVARRAAERGLGGLAQATIHVVAVARAQGLGGVCERQGVVVGIGEEVFSLAGRNRGAAGGEVLGPALGSGMQARTPLVR